MCIAQIPGGVRAFGPVCDVPIDDFLVLMVIRGKSTITSNLVDQASASILLALPALLPYNSRVPLYWQGTAIQP